MAGAGYKLFNTGDVLTAAQVNTYLQEQVVMVFANAAARTTALSGVLAEGMVSYLKDTNATEVYDGSNWIGIGNSGDITGVTAGTGISGGGTTGTVTITNSMATEITAKGDLIVGTGNATFDNLAAGTNGFVLTAASGETTGLKWAAAPTAVAFRAFRGTTQTLTSATFTKIQLASETFDTNNWFDSTTNYRFTPQIAGYYRISGTINFNASTRTIGMFYKNGTEVLRWIDAYPAYAASATDIFYMNGTTDYIELYAYVTGGALQVLGDTTWTTLSGEYIGA